MVLGKYYSIPKFSLKSWQELVYLMKFISFLLCLLKSMTVRENCMARALCSKDVGVGMFMDLWGEIKQFMASWTFFVIRHPYVWNTVKGKRKWGNQCSICNAFVRIRSHGSYIRSIHFPQDLALSKYWIILLLNGRENGEKNKGEIYRLNEHEMYINYYNIYYNNN